MTLDARFDPFRPDLIMQFGRLAERGDGGGVILGTSGLSATRFTFL